MLRQIKVPKRKATPSLRPLRCAKGQTCGVSVAGCAVELALRCARRSDSHGESVHEAWALRRPCSPRNRPAAGAASRGGEPNNQTAGHPFGLSLGSAWPAQRVALAPASWGRAQRSEAKVRVDVLSPLPLWMRRGAQGLADQGSRLSERSEFERGPAKPEHRRLPRRAAAGTQTVGSPFLWFLSFGDAKERDSPAGRLPASALNPGTELNSSTSSNSLSQVLPDAEEMLLKK